MPPAERAYLNRAYARVLRATQAKLRLLKALAEGGAGMPAAAEVYRDRTRSLSDGLGRDPPPAGLEPFRDEVREALRLQLAFFEKAVQARRAGGAMQAVFSIPEGRQASTKLVSAWGRMQARYPALAAETRDSLYHHLCALDLF